MGARRDVRMLDVDGDRVRVYTLGRAATVLDMSQRTLQRQLQQGSFQGAGVWAPKGESNPTNLWLLSADEVDELAGMQPGGAKPAAVRTDLEAENAALRARVETLELEEALRYRDRVQELERENADLRAQLEHRDATLSLLATESQRAMTVAANVLGGLAPRPFPRSA